MEHQLPLQNVALQFLKKLIFFYIFKLVSKVRIMRVYNRLLDTYNILNNEYEEDKLSFVFHSSKSF